MTVFKPGSQVTTEQPTVSVDKLTLGTHVFQLVVVDDDGNESAPDRAEVTVMRSTRPSQPEIRGRPTETELTRHRGPPQR